MVTQSSDAPDAGAPGEKPEPPTPAPGPNPDPSPKPPAPPGVPGPGKNEPNPAAAPDAPVPGRQPAVDTRGTGQPRAEGNAVYRIDPDGFVTEIFRQPVLVLSLFEKQGALLIATGSGTEGLVYQVSPAAEETVVLAKVNPKQILSLLPAADGRLYLGLANVGGIAAMNPGVAKEGKYTSAVLDAGQISRFGNLQLHGSLPAETALTISTRSGNVRDSSQNSWSKWSEAAAASEFIPITSPSARFFQYRLTFTSTDGSASPVVEDVSVSYQMPNLPPQIKSIRVATGPDASAAAAGAGEAEPVRVPSARKQIVSWEAADPNADPVTYALYFRRGSSSPWILMKEKIRENQFEWDTRAVADGRYQVRIVATDAAANPPGRGRTSARVSDPVVVDNSPPIIGDLKWRQKGETVQVDLKIVDRSSVVAALDYTINSNRDWQSVLPSDNIFDGPDEAVTLSLKGLPAGTHQVTVRGTDARGNQAFENVIVNVEGPAAAK